MIADHEQHNQRAAAHAAVLANAADVLDQLAGNLRAAAANYDDGAPLTASDFATVAEAIADAHVHHGWHDPTPRPGRCYGFDRATGGACARPAGHPGECGTA